MLRNIFFPSIFQLWILGRMKFLYESFFTPIRLVKNIRSEGSLARFFTSRKIVTLPVMPLASQFERSPRLENNRRQAGPFFPYHIVKQRSISPSSALGSSILLFMVVIEL